MFIRIDPSSGIPLYLQIKDHIRTEVALGRLAAGDALPSVRQLAVDLTINPNTVARAYLELEHEGVIYKRQGQGTFVAAQSLEMSKRERRQVFNELAAKTVSEGVRLGLNEREMTEIFQRTIERLLTGSREKKAS